MLTPANEEVHRPNRRLAEDFFADPEVTADDFKRIYEEFLALLEVPSDARFEAVDAGGVPCLWATAPGASMQRTIVHYHSGGYLIGSALGYRGFGARLSAATGARVLLVDYRLAPEHPFPASIDDALGAYRWVRDQGVAARDVALCGDSAGGAMVLITLQALRDAGEQLPAAGVCMSPYADLAVTGESAQANNGADPLVTPDLIGGMVAMYVPEGHDPKDPRISPMYGDFSGLPPLLIMVGSIEVLLDDARRCAANAQAAGVDVTLDVVPDMVHIWPIFADRLPEAQEALDATGRYLRDRLGSDQPS